MIWIIIIAVIVITTGKFFYDKNQQASKIVREGGMRKKYRELIGYIMEGDSRTKIFQEDSDSISLGISSMGGTTLFILIQTFGKLTVQWKVDSPVFGKHKMEWDFPEYGDQKKMIERIMNDLSKYQSNMMQNFM
jgi:hypothetical protein